MPAWEGRPPPGALPAPGPPRCCGPPCPRRGCKEDPTPLTTPHPASCRSPHPELQGCCGLCSPTQASPPRSKLAPSLLPWALRPAPLHPLLPLTTFRGTPGAWSGQGAGLQLHHCSLRLRRRTAIARVSLGPPGSSQQQSPYVTFHSEVQVDISLGGQPFTGRGLCEVPRTPLAARPAPESWPLRLKWRLLEGRPGSAARTAAPHHWHAPVPHLPSSDGLPLPGLPPQPCLGPSDRRQLPSHLVTPRYTRGAWRAQCRSSELGRPALGM